MLVFMEYCDEGTIAEAAKNGLPEGLIRQYTKEICTAISVLHQNNIIHRDIKGKPLSSKHWMDRTTSDNIVSKE